MRQDKLTFITTVFNEEKNITLFLKSIFLQTKLPDEIIIVDGGSSDKTLQIISKFNKSKSNKRPLFKVIVKKGNRAVGRNEAIRIATGSIILSSDAGNILDKKWIENISKPFKDKTVDVVAGYYKGISNNIFQKSLIPYVLVMEDKINEKEFLPATRSMAFRKNIWKKIGGFDEKLSHNEDYEFANKLKAINSKIVFEKKAIVNWMPRKNLKEAFVMFFRFAFGDGESGILRDKVLLIFARYVFFLYLIAISILIKSSVLLSLIVILPILYVPWSINKNYKYVKDNKAFIILPALQILSDVAVLIGTSFGVVKFLLGMNYKILVKNNLSLIILLIIYVLTMLSVITSGIPGQSHPFAYQMDEWHQFQSVRTVLKYGTPNVIGSANGTMFNFFLSGVMLVPFYLLKIVNPFAIKSAVDSLLEQEKLFILLRLFTLFFGSLTVVYIAKIAKLLKTNSILMVSMFIFTPVWLVLSNFFKYDIALTFWITISAYYLFKYSIAPSRKNFVLASILSGVAFSVKVSGIPLLPILILAFLMFSKNYKRNYKDLLFGVLIFLFITIFFGFPDIIFGGRNMNDYLFGNVISGPSALIQNYNLSYSLWNLTVLHKLPEIFGHILYPLTVISLIWVGIIAVNQFMKKNYPAFKLNIFLISSFLLFLISLVPLRITISANRAVVLLPFIVIINAIAFRELVRLLRKRKILLGLISVSIIVLFCIQVFESYLWVRLKISNLPMQASSAWILKNIPSKSNIGLENIPIYQFEPDLVLKEFYNKQYHPNIETKYNYFIIDSDTKVLPKYIILSNVNYEQKYLIKSSKNNIIKRIIRENYFIAKYFPLEVPYYKYFDNNFSFPFVGTFAYPDGITIYEKK